MSLNTFVLVGTVNNPPDVKFLQSGKQVTAITLDVPRDYIPQGQTAPAVDDIGAEAFGETAQRLQAALTRPGLLLLVRGKVVVRHWQGQDGSDRRAMNLSIDSFDVLGAVGAGAPIQQPAAAPPPVQPTPTPAPAQAQGWGGSPATPAPVSAAAPGWQSPGDIQDPFANQ